MSMNLNCPQSRASIKVCSLLFNFSYQTYFLFKRGKKQGFLEKGGRKLVFWEKGGKKQGGEKAGGEKSRVPTLATSIHFRVRETQK